MSFLDLARNRKAAFDDITKKLKEQTAGGSYEKDPRYWQPVVGKEGNGFAVFRFLPQPSGEDLPFVRKFSHSFKGPGGWYIENSLTTLGQKDPVGEENSRLWATDIEANRELARARKRKLGFISNILVLKHAARPEDEGKVFLYSYGKKIFDKINDKMNPPVELGIPGMNPFDFWAGANFILRIKTVSKFQNYDDSSFDTPSALYNAPDGEDTPDGKLAKIYESLYSLKAEISPDKFKSYADLESRFLRVIGEGRAARAPERERAQPQARDEERPPFDLDDDEGGGGEDPESFFKKLAGG